MRGLLTAVTAALSFMTAGAAQATVLTFETPVTDYFISNKVGPYPGLTFQYFSTVSNVSYPTSGYTNVITSGTQSACGCAADFGQKISSITSDTPFDFIGGSFASAWVDGVTLLVNGYVNGAVLYSDLYFLDTKGRIQTFYFMGIDRLEFSIVDVPPGAFPGSGDYFAVDDLVINSHAVPEPATWTMLIAGFGAMGGALRRRQRRSLEALA